MKNFQVFLNEAKTPEEQIFYKNYVFSDGLIILSDAFYYGWQYFTNFNSEGDLTLKAKTKDVVFQFIQGIPVISVPVKSFSKSGNIVIDDVEEFYQSDEFKVLNKHVELNHQKILDAKGK